VNPPNAFWDASALVPLCAGQKTTAQVTALSIQYGVVVWWATQVEIAAVIAKLARMKFLDHTQLRQSQALAAKLSDSWYAITPSDTLLKRALRNVERFDLRSGDSLQLAAAQEWCGDQPQGRVFLAADKRLRDAAHLTGFDAPLMS
jgi:predicted nucleic acid-binding protein